MKKLLTKFAATTLFAVAAVTSGFAQANLGADCGCPPVASRGTPILMSTLADAGGELTATNTVLDCQHTYTLDKKIYVPAGKTITIQPGSLIRGVFTNQAQAANAACLVVEVGGKINAEGTPTCQIVFTALADNLDGTFPIANNGQWGGVLIAGKASNNLTLAANGPFQAGIGDGKICVADGIGTFEGFASSNSKDQFGVTPAQFNDDDSSGVLKYVSIRHAGAILQVGGELNGLSLGSVGRKTVIEHVEVVSSADDGIEVWGGTVNLKYISFLFGNDDNLDWDDGWRGKAQFLFVMKTDQTASVDADNGFEMDADDQKSNLLPRSHPVIYNATMIGNSKVALTSDNSGLAAIEAKELTEGEIYNSIFANWRYGLNLIKTLGTRTGTSESYHNWSATAGNSSNSLKVKCNTFTGVIQKTIAIDKNGTGTVSNADSTQFFTTDKNVVLASIPGFSYTLGVNNTTNAFTSVADVMPNPALSTTGCPVAPADGFFTPASYRGAFDPSNNWLSDWAYSNVLHAVGGLVSSSCVTDLNHDGVTDNIDFLQMLGQFGQSCR